MNTITTIIPGIDIATFDEYLPFEDKKVWVYDISKQFKSYGHWTLYLDIEIDGKRHELKCLTTDSMMIDDWHEGGKEQAIRMVLINNEEKLQEIAEVI